MQYENQSIVNIIITSYIFSILFGSNNVEFNFLSPANTTPSLTLIANALEPSYS